MEMQGLEKTLAALCSIATLPSVDGLIPLLQWCRRAKDLTFARCVSAYICAWGLDMHHALGNFFVPMLVDCVNVDNAQQFFLRLACHNEFCWTSLIKGHVDDGQWYNAFSLFYQMLRDDCVHPSSCTLQGITKACADLQCVDFGMEIHSEMIQEGFEADLYVGSTLINMYAKCGFLIEAQRVFDQLSEYNVVLWTVLIAGYAEWGYGHGVLYCLKNMQRMGVSPNDATFVCSLKTCNTCGDIGIVMDIHSEIATEEYERDPFVGSALVGAYLKCDSVAEAQEVFTDIAVRDLVLWNTIITGYAEHGLVEQVFDCLNIMQSEGVNPNEATFLNALKCCATKDLNKVFDLHDRIAKVGCEKDQFVSNTLVDTYAKCGFLLEAQDVFSELPFKCVVSWTALISGYMEQGCCEEALSFLQKMEDEHLQGDAVTIIFVLKACSSTKAFERGHGVHSQVIKEGLEKDSSIGNTLLDMYAKCGLLLEARYIIDKLPVRSAATWTALVMGYAEYGLGNEALDCWDKLRFDKVPLDVVILACTLKACMCVGAIDTGREIHAAIVQHGFEMDLLAGNALIDMYAKCSSLSEAMKLFEDILFPSVVSWTAITAGYASQGKSKNVLDMFERMKEEAVCPDGVMFLILLTVCSRAGLVDKGKQYFGALRIGYGVTLNIEHYNCMIDLLGRAGRLNDVYELLEEMNLQPNMITWNTLMGACQKWGWVELARQAFESAIKLDRKHEVPYIVMANIYMDANMVEDARKVNALRMNV